MNSIRFRAPPTHAPLPPHPRSFARVSHSPRASHTRLFVRVPRDKPVSSSPLLLSFTESLRENSPLRSRKRVGESVNRSKGSRPLLLARFSPSSAREENNRGVNVGVSSSLYVNRSNSRQAIKCKAVSRWIGGEGSLHAVPIVVAYLLFFFRDPFVFSPLVHLVQTGKITWDGEDGPIVCNPFFRAI